MLIMSNRLKSQITLKKLLSFVTIGAFLTLASLAANFIALRYFDLPLLPTYVMTYMITILISFLLNSKYTYGNAINFKNSLRYYSIYLTSMGIGAGMLSVFDYLLDFQKWVYPFLVLPFTLSFNFIVSFKTLKLKSDEA